MKQLEDDEFSTEDFDATERAKLRRIMRADDTARILWGSARTLAIWITAVTVGIAAFKSFLVDALLGKHP